MTAERLSPVLQMEAIEAARRVVAVGATPREQGRALGEIAKDKIRELYDIKLAQYRGSLERWDEIVAGARPLMQRLTPHTYDELLGQAEGAGMAASGALGTEERSRPPPVPGRSSGRAGQPGPPIHPDDPPLLRER